MATLYDKKSQINFLKMIDKCIAEEESLINTANKNLLDALNSLNDNDTLVKSLCSSMKNRFMIIRGLNYAKSRSEENDSSYLK